MSSFRLPRWLSGKESTCQSRTHRRCGFDSWVGKIPWRRKWQPIPVFLPGKSHGQRSLVGYSLWGHRVTCNWTYTHSVKDRKFNKSCDKLFTVKYGGKHEIQRNSTKDVNCSSAIFWLWENEVILALVSKIRMKVPTS